MPREHGRVNVTIWTDPEWRKLPPAAQHLYLLLWTSPSLTYCGTHDWRPGRLAALSEGFSAEHIETVGDCLSARYFLVTDEATDETLVRSWARFDGLMKQPRMAVSLANAYANVASEPIRGVLVTEVGKIRQESPELSCWKDRRVIEMLNHPAVSAKDLPTPEDPFREGFTPSLGMGLPQATTDVSGKVWVPPTPAPTPATYSIAPTASSPSSDETTETSKRKRPTRALPNDWQPTEAHRDYATTESIDLPGEVERFRLHAEANDRRVVEWNAAFAQWLRSPHVRHAAPTQRNPLPTADELEEPPDGLSPEQYARWDHERRQRLAERRRA